MWVLTIRHSLENFNLLLSSFSSGVPPSQLFLRIAVKEAGLLSFSQTLSICDFGALTEKNQARMGTKKSFFGYVQQRASRPMRKETFFDQKQMGKFLLNP